MWAIETEMYQRSRLHHDLEVPDGTQDSSHESIRLKTQRKNLHRWGDEPSVYPLMCSCLFRHLSTTSRGFPLMRGTTPTAWHQPVGELQFKSPRQHLFLFNLQIEQHKKKQPRLQHPRDSLPHQLSLRSLALFFLFVSLASSRFLVSSQPKKETWMKFEKNKK